MEIKGDEVIFSTGTRRYANNGIIGLSPDGDVSEGHDGGFWEPEEGEWRDDELTPSELVELADHMIAEWTAFKLRHQP